MRIALLVLFSISSRSRPPRWEILERSDLMRGNLLDGLHSELSLPMISVRLGVAKALRNPFYFSLIIIYWTFEIVRVQSERKTVSIEMPQTTWKVFLDRNKRAIREKRGASSDGEEKENINK